MKTNKSAEQLLGGKRVALIGAGVSNMPLIPFVISLGGNVVVREKKTEEDLGERAEEIKAAGAFLITGDGYLDNLTEDVIIRSPGIRPDIPELKEAAARGAVITCEMELFCENAPCPVYAVTGSDGKSTTTTILSKILSPRGKAYLGGNIGEPLFHKIFDMSSDDGAAVELSSFQLMEFDVPVRAAVITNVTPNHLNWHTGMDEYIAAKKNILKNAEMCVLNYDNDVTVSIARELIGEGRRVTLFSLNEFPEMGEERAIFLEDGAIWFRDGSGKNKIIDRGDIVLPGRHNVANYMAAAGAAWDDTTPEKIKAVASSFGGVKHRLQLVENHGGVRYYNSSIDSSPTRTAAALSALGETCPERPIIIILGGYDKNIPFEPLAEALKNCASLKAVVITGHTGKKIKDAIDKNPGKYGIYEEKCFDDAVARAVELAEDGDNVLLSPACASFDEFPNFEVRGERFASLVKKS